MDADDVMQDAALTALPRIGDVREPEAVGAWLRMIVRNGSRLVLRQAEAVRPVGDLPRESTRLGPEQWSERNASRDWVREAVDGLPPALRMPLVLRHLTTGVTSYERIVDVFGAPVGTVRSRLSRGRARMASALAATADPPHGDAELRLCATRVEARALLAAARQRPVRQAADSTVAS
ncbi:RNA polymerase sigma factor [Streptomyces sp. NPDC088350]|uniref:RNA polymerase sigma factor n=1 Tax=Streptomyces sp. NPDC088350 TaxID=3365854 RepID=UPI0037F5BC13